MKSQIQAALRAREAATYLGIGISTLWRRSKTDPTFPKPRKLGQRVTIWMREDLDAFLARCDSNHGSQQ